MEAGSLTGEAAVSLSASFLTRVFIPCSNNSSPDSLAWSNKQNELGLLSPSPVQGSRTWRTSQSRFREANVQPWRTLYRPRCAAGTWTVDTLVFHPRRVDNFTIKTKIDLIHKTNSPERPQAHRGEGREAASAPNLPTSEG